MEKLALAPHECQSGASRRPGDPVRRQGARCARMVTVDLDAFRWLLTAEGQRLLASAAMAGSGR